MQFNNNEQTQVKIPWFLKKIFNKMHMKISNCCQTTNFDQVMACCLSAPSQYLHQCWLTISEILWHSFQGNVYFNTQDINPQVVKKKKKSPSCVWNKIYIYEITATSHKGWSYCSLALSHLNDLMQVYTMPTTTDGIKTSFWFTGFSHIPRLL